MNKEPIMIIPSKMNANDIYETLCKELNFNTMIELYKLIKHKMEYLNDEPVMTVTCYKESVMDNENNS